jgi:RimJ/RimL family protein N-acetyltransferase
VRLACLTDARRSLGRVGRDGTTRRLADPGAMLAGTHELADGSRIRLRLTRPTDGPRIHDFLERLSPDTRLRRFLAPAPALSEWIVQRFSYYDPRERIVLAATEPLEGREAIVGLADAAFIDKGTAEVAVVVDDELQGRGLGKMLSEAIATLALRRGIKCLRAEMLQGNRRMLRLLERLGETHRTNDGGHAVAYTRLRADRRLNAA